MKKLTVFIFFLSLCIPSFSQETYLLMEMMDVDPNSNTSYLEVEEFWSKIHQQRVNAGEIRGWDLWTFIPAGTEQEYRFMTVTFFESAVSMFEGLTDESINKHAAAVYPDMSENELNAMLEQTGTSRDIAAQIYSVESDKAGEFKVGLGTYATMAWMKTDHPDYLEMESEIFKPMHTKSIEAGEMMGWSLISFIFPYGTSSYASHVAMNFFEDLEQCINYSMGGNETSMTQQLAIEQGLSTREMKSISMGQVIMSVR